MTYFRFRPYGRFSNLQERINRLFEENSTDQETEDHVSESCWAPLTDIFEDKTRYVLRMELPGVSKKDVDINLKEHRLSVEGERREDLADQKDVLGHRRERACGRFHRAFSLPDDVDSEKLSAKMDAGILEITLPKQEERKARTIPIKVD